MTEARLQIFKGPRAIAELRPGRRVEWSAARASTFGEIAFFYHAAPTSAIVAVGRALEDPRPDRTWKYLAWFDRVMLQAPLSLRELRQDPVAGRWSVWRMLSRTTARVPPVTAAALARLVLARDLRPQAWLQPFLGAFEEPASGGEVSAVHAASEKPACPSDLALSSLAPVGARRKSSKARSNGFHPGARTSVLIGGRTCRRTFAREAPKRM